MEDYETAFGVTVPAFEDAFEIGAKRIGHELIAEELSDETFQLLNDLALLPLYLSGHVLSGVQKAERTVVLAFINDFPAFINYVLEGDGRGAALRARVLFEHLINYCTVTSEPGLAQQYLDHNLISKRRVAERATGVQYLQGRERENAERKARRLLENTKSRYERLMSKHGPWFRTRWDKTSIKNRATEFDLEQLYEGYGILSGVVHGDAGSLAGVHNVKGADTIMRVGGDLKLAGLAYVEGLECAREFLIRVSRSGEVGQWAFEIMLDAVERGLETSGEVKRALSRADSQIWPEGPTPGPFAICGLFPGGDRWYLFEPKMGTLLAAERPSLNPMQEASLERLREDELPHYDWEAFQGRPMTVAFFGKLAVPKLNARPVPADAVLVPNALRWSLNK